MNTLDVVFVVFSSAIILAGIGAAFMVWAGRWVIAVDHEDCASCRDLPTYLRELAD